MKYLFIFILSLNLHSLDYIRVKGDLNQGKDYFIGLLKLVEEQTEEYGDLIIKEVRLDMNQSRVAYELERGGLVDLAWFGTSNELEENLRAIKIPLYGGLLGYRALVIRSDRVEEFKNIETLDDLKKLVAIQGSSWIDTKILIDNGFIVNSSSSFESLYSMLENNRGDFFPRGIAESYREVKEREKFLVFDQVLLYYPLPMYFFVNKDNEKLAARIELGLERSMQDGSFLSYLEEADETKDLFPLEKYKESEIFTLNNRYITYEDKGNIGLWLDIEK